MTGIELFANQAQTTVTSGGTTAPASGTSETWTVASSTGFPLASSSASPKTFFRVTDVNAGASGEKMIVTNVSGTTWTVTRGAEGTTPVVHAGGFTIQNVLTAAALSGFNQVDTTDWVNVIAAYGADPTGGVDSTAAIQAALLSFGTLGGAVQGQGGTVYLPPGQYMISKPLVIPAGVRFTGGGWGSQLTLVTNSNCDMIQAASDSSVSQAAVLGVSASAIANAFWSGVYQMWLHGDSFHVTTPGYCHGINVTTSPTLTTAGADPDFDPMFSVENVRVEAVTGDGYFHEGRSGAFLKRVWVAYMNGNGFTFSFDTTAVDCLAEGTNCGFYMDHASNVGAGCKSYNNNDYSWFSGTSYSPGSTVVYLGTMYFCLLAVSGSTVPSADGTHWVALTVAGGAWVSGTSYVPGDAVTSSGGTYICILAVSGATAPASDGTHWAAPTPAWVSGTSYSPGVAVAYLGTMYYCLLAVSGSTAPASDGTHWSAVSGATSPQATGCGYYWDSNCGEHSWAACDGQENSRGDYYFHGPLAGTISVDGTSANINYNNGQPSYNSANPNHYAAVTFDGCSGVNIRLSTNANSGGSGIICTSLNSPGSNTLIATTDGTEAALFNGGTPGFALINGVFQSLVSAAGGTDTSGTATASTPTFTSGTAKQLSTVQDVMLYIDVTVATNLTLAIGSTSSVTTTVFSSATAAIGLVSVRVPKGWYVKLTSTGTFANFTYKQVTC